MKKELLTKALEELSRLNAVYLPLTLVTDDSIREKISEKVYPFVLEDLDSFAEKDPASKGRSDYIFEKYTTFEAIMYYRFANAIYYCELLKKQFREEHAREVSEDAKVITRIEIHPAAKIGHRFTIDHGVGTLIGETCEIGDDCYMLQGVTLGAIKITNNNLGKRHPTLGRGVEIGAFARIFGPITIGNDVDINSHCVITQNIPSNQEVVIINQLQLYKPSFAPLSTMSFPELLINFSYISPRNCSAGTMFLEMITKD